MANEGPEVLSRSTESRPAHRVTFAEGRDEYVIDSDLEDPVSNPATAGRAGDELTPARPSIIKQARNTRSDTVENRENPFVADGELRRKADYILQHSTISRARIRIADPDHIKLDESSSSTDRLPSPGGERDGQECRSPGRSPKQKQPVIGRVVPMTNPSQTSPSKSHVENEALNSELDHKMTGEFPPQSKSSVLKAEGPEGFSPPRSHEKPTLRAHENAVQRSQGNGCETTPDSPAGKSGAHLKQRRSSLKEEEIIKPGSERRRTLCCSIQ